MNSNISSTAHALDSSSVLPVDEETLPKIRALHPKQAGRATNLRPRLSRLKY